MKRQKGITLIALVITIIVMLIMVAVTINMAVNGGLFSYASKAAKETEKEFQKEQELASLQSGLSDDDLIARFTGGWYEAADGEFTNGEYTVNLGDYINYQCYNETSYSESGFTVNSSSNDLKWQVIGAENGKLLIVSENSLGNLTLTGSDGCINGVNKLNTICAIYGHGQHAIGARSIKIEDVNKLTGYNPEHDERWNIEENDDNPYGYGEICQYRNIVTYTLTTTGIDYSGTNGITGTFTSSNAKLIKLGESTSTSPLTIESTHYDYESDMLPRNSIKARLVFGDGTRENGKLYWLASPFVRTSEGNVSWGLFYVFPAGVSGMFLWESIDGVDTHWGTVGVYAIVSIASDVKLKSATAVNGINAWDFEQDR